MSKYYLKSLFQYNTFKMVGGENGKSNGEEVVLQICNYMFSEQLLSNMTWTGKSGQKEKKKIAFKSFVQLIDLFYKLSNAADNTFDDKSCHRVFVYKVLKYAYKKTTDVENSNKAVVGLIEEAQTVRNDGPSIVGTADPTCHTAAGPSTGSQMADTSNLTNYQQYQTQNPTQYPLQNPPHPYPYPSQYPPQYPSQYPLPYPPSYSPQNPSQQPPQQYQPQYHTL